GGGGELREPVVDGGEESDDSSHGHDEVKMADDEGGVVQVLVEDRLGEDRTGKASRDEERDEAERKEHRRGVAWTRAPGCGNPTENLGGGGQGDRDGGDGECCAGEGVEASDEQVMAPEQDAEEADGERGGDHQAVAKDAAMAEIGEDHRSQAHAGQDGDVDLRVP